MNYVLTVAIPTFNRSKILKRNLENLFEFIGPNTEILVSDNGSTDDTEEVCKGLQHNNNFRYLRHSSNKGYDVNVITCATHAKGEYIWFLSDDDLITQELYAKVCAILKSKIYAGILVNGEVIESSSGNKIIESLSPLKENCEIIADDKSMPISFKWSTLLSSQILKKNKIEYGLMDKFIGTVFVQLGMFWGACRNERVYLLCDHYLKKYDAATNNFGKSTAYIWLWNLLDASKLLNVSGYSLKAVKQAQSSIYRSGVLSYSGVVAHYVLSRIEHEGHEGFGNIKKILEFVHVKPSEYVTLIFLTFLPSRILKKFAYIIKAIIK